MQLRQFPKEFSIMILDNELNIIGETLMEGDKYVPNNMFVTEEGLYISVNHPDNPDNREDFLSFALLVLEDDDWRDPQGFQNLAGLPPPEIKGIRIVEEF